MHWYACYVLCTVPQQPQAQRPKAPKLLFITTSVIVRLPPPPLPNKVFPAWPQGDVNDETGFSPFPGNINQLVLKVDSYCRELERSRGVIGEFVNPKYKDATKTAFKSSTRLECMMQASTGR